MRRNFRLILVLLAVSVFGSAASADTELRVGKSGGPRC